MLNIISIVRLIWKYLIKVPKKIVGSLPYNSAKSLERYYYVTYQKKKLPLFSHCNRKCLMKYGIKC